MAEPKEFAAEAERNLARVDSLVALYEAQAPARGRPAVDTADLLRAATVFLHAIIEDFLRSLLAWHLPGRGSKDSLDKVPLIGVSDFGRPKKFFLGELAAHRGKAVEAVLQESVESHLQVSNFNNRRDVLDALRTVGVAEQVVSAHLASLEAMMARRHLIVHRADANPNVGGTGNFAAASLDKGTVRTWRASVRTFIDDVVAAL